MRRTAALAAITLVLYGCTQHPQTAATSQQQPAPMPADPDAFDREIVRQLIAHGSDVTKPARVVYSLYIPSRRDAEAAARELRAAGYRAKVQDAVGKLPGGRPETRAWLVAANVAIPSLEHARQERRHLDALAKRYHGEYGGWGADVVK